MKAVAKLAAIAFLAALAAWLPVAVLFGLDMDSNLRPTFALRLLPVALLGSFGIGLPVALCAYFLARTHLKASLWTLVLIAALSGVMITLTSLVLFDPLAALLFGPTSLIAALTYAVLGWLWILKPMRDAERG